MTLTTIEYNVIMQAINNAYDEIDDDTFIDPYAEGADEYDNETLREALESVENKLMAVYLPR